MDVPLSVPRQFIPRQFGNRHPREKQCPGHGRSGFETSVSRRGCRAALNDGNRRCFQPGARCLHVGAGFAELFGSHRYSACRYGHERLSIALPTRLDALAFSSVTVTFRLEDVKKLKNSGGALLTLKNFALGCPTGDR
jgi:hypothetical protein